MENWWRAAAFPIENMRLGCLVVWRLFFCFFFEAGRDHFRTHRFEAQPWVFKIQVKFMDLFKILLKDRRECTCTSFSIPTQQLEVYDFACSWSNNCAEPIF